MPHNECFHTVFPRLLMKNKNICIFSYLFYFGGPLENNIFYSRYKEFFTISVKTFLILDLRGACVNFTITYFCHWINIWYNYETYWVVFNVYQNGIRYFHEATICNMYLGMYGSLLMVQWTHILIIMMILNFYWFIVRSDQIIAVFCFICFLNVTVGLCATCTWLS